MSNRLLKNFNTFLEQYNEKGYFIVPNVFEVEPILNVANKLLKTPPKIRSFLEKDGRPRTIWSPHYDSFYLNDFVRNESINPLIPILRKVLGGDIYLNQCHFNYKLANGGGKFNWHSDYTVFKTHDKWKDLRGLSVFYLLDDMTLENGNMHFAVGSHKKIVPLKQGYSLPNTFTEARYGDIKKYDRGLEQGDYWTAPSEISEEMPLSNDLYRVEKATAKAGDCVVFHGNVWHMSPTNNSNKDRKVFILCYNHIDNTTEYPITNHRDDWMTLKDFTPC